MSILRTISLGVFFGLGSLDHAFAQNAPIAKAQDNALSLHLQATGILQTAPAFSAAYSGPNSLNSRGETKHTLSFDLYAGAELWKGAEAHVDGLAWQGFGLSNAVGAEGFPNGEAFRLGTNRPDAILARIFVRQTIPLGSEQEKVDEDLLHLGGEKATSRLTITLGKFSAKDVFDNNSYANDPRTQFLNWALMANEGWDYPADSLGFETGFAAELNQNDWAVRYGIFQMPKFSNAMPADPHLLKAWGMVVELERRFRINQHTGAVRGLVYDNQAHMGSYLAALGAQERPANIVTTRAYRGKHGIELNFEQEITKNMGIFSRLGWSDGRNEAWCFSDVDRDASGGISVKGSYWRRKQDTFGLAGSVNALSTAHQAYLAAGGTNILAGDGALTYGTERIVETYYDFEITKGLNTSFDYQYLAHPAFNRDRGPVSIYSARVHWQY